MTPRDHGFRAGGAAVVDVIRIVDRVDEDGRIRNQTFEECEIRGPAMLALEVEPITLEACSFGGTFDSIFHLTEKPEIRGAIGLRNVAFRRCVFEQIGFIGPPEVIEKFGQDILR